MNEKSALSPPLVCCTLTLFIRILCMLQDIIKVMNMCYFLCLLLSKFVIETSNTHIYCLSYTLEVYVLLFHKDAKSFRNLIINIHSVFSPHLGTQILKISKRGRPKKFWVGGNQKGGGRFFKFHDLTHAWGLVFGRGPST